MKTKIEQYVIDRVKAKRMEQHISQVVLADSINVSKGFVGNVEVPTNDYKYNINHLNEIAKVLKCSIKDFFPDEPLE
ncbi:helix-turn-helix transcriptional regulator [Parabacteroides acidifaciens]|uniref:Helix-turn-helix transcriptional regulator n=1 Tax=Parabacteroides acidifaciens TaxID=2290935 RepID=A0A3D8HHM1_9BACT|nr:helix-turn-helix transcriptional regulator [Parabacteroides acidifaciens]MBC8601148.1 helix-turn-helix transcriptional regulator [Parabacteroides acidifaciens]RDU50210.1 XRE family transcriptional regulator [Parabacteroides acidifaciens]